MRTSKFLCVAGSVSIILIRAMVSLEAQSDDLAVRIEGVGFDWMGSANVLLGLEQIPNNVAVQVSVDLGSWRDQLDVCSRSNRVMVSDRGVPLATEGTRFYRIRAPGISVESALALWRAQGLQSYSYHFRRTCFCFEVIREADVTVIESQVVSATNVVYGWHPDSSWKPPDQPDLSKLMTIEQLFEVVMAAQQDSDLVAVSYDPIMGYPRHIAVDQVFEHVDDEDELHVDRVTPASPSGP